MSELKPCPFCGGKAKKVFRIPFSFVKCTKCNIGTPFFGDQQEEGDSKTRAIEAWNRRVGK